MRIAIVTDAWKPQVNGVVTTLSTVERMLVARGHELRVFGPEIAGRTLPLPSYPEIRVALAPGRRLSAALDAFRPERLHVATEAPMGLAARAWARRGGHAFTTSFHTQFPEYLRKRAPVPEDWSYGVLKWFHNAAARTLVPTARMLDRLAKRGFDRLALWTRGVDTETFRPDEPLELGLPRPVWVYAGRIAVEKNLEAFLALDLPGSKLLVGDGPARETLARQYPDARFVGYRFGRDLARHVAAGDVFVFPSRTDTFGLVMLEAMACGLPVAAFPVTGPVDVVRPGRTGMLDEDLRAACLGALELDGADCVAQAREYGWDRCADQFLRYLAPTGL